MQSGMDVVPAGTTAGTTLSLTTSSSSSTAIPNDDAGKRAKFVRVSVTGSAYVKFAAGSAVATTGDYLINVGDATVFAVAAFDHFAGIADSGTPKMNVVAVQG